MFTVWFDFRSAGFLKQGNTCVWSIPWPLATPLPLTFGTGRNRRVRPFRKNSTLIITLKQNGFKLWHVSRYFLQVWSCTRNTSSSSAPTSSSWRKTWLGNSWRREACISQVRSPRRTFNPLPRRRPPSHILWSPSGGPLKDGFGFLSFSGVSRLTWLVDLFGELSVKAASTVEEPERRYTKMTAHMLTKDQKWVAFQTAAFGHLALATKQDPVD